MLIFADYLLIQLIHKCLYLVRFMRIKYKLNNFNELVQIF